MKHYHDHEIEMKLKNYFRKEAKSFSLPEETELRAMQNTKGVTFRVRTVIRYLSKAVAACLCLALVMGSIIYLPMLKKPKPTSGNLPGIIGTGESLDDDLTGGKETAPLSDGKPETDKDGAAPETEIPSGNETAGDVLFDKESLKPMGTGSTVEGLSEVSLVEYTVKGGHLSVTLSFVNGTGKSLILDADYGVQYYDGEAWQDCAANEYFHGFYDTIFEIFEGGPWKESYVVSCFDVSRPGLYRFVKYIGFDTENYVWVEFNLSEGFKAAPDKDYVGGDEVTWAASFATIPVPDITIDYDTEIPDTTDVVEPVPPVIVRSVEPFFEEEELYMDPPNLWIDEDTGHLMLALYVMNPREEAYIMNGPYWHLMIWRDGDWTYCPTGALGGVDFPDVEVPIEGLKDWQLTCDLSEAYDLSEAGAYRFVKDAICAVEFELTEGLPTNPKPDSPYPDGKFAGMEILRTDGLRYAGTDKDGALNKLYYILSEMKGAEGSESREVVINGKPDYIIRITYQNGVTEEIALYAGGESFYTWGEVLDEAVIIVQQNAAWVDEALLYLNDVIFDREEVSESTVPADSVDVPETPADTTERLPETTGEEGYGSDVYETETEPIPVPDTEPAETEPVHQNKSGSKVISGGESVRPASGFLSSTEYVEDENGFASVAEGCGEGVWGICNDLILADAVPELIYEGDVTVSFADENAELNLVFLLTVDLETDGFSYDVIPTTLDGLSELPAGHHFVVLRVTRTWGENGQNKTVYEDLFELIVE